MLEIAIEALGLKDVPRAGWILRGVQGPESVADHSWGTALLCMLYAAAEGVDPGRAVQIAVVHDLAECRVGDIPARVNPDAREMGLAEKSRLEREAMDALLSASAGDPASVDQSERARTLWQEYEDRSSPEAIFVRDMNLIDMCLTAFRYERDRRYDPDDGNPNFPDFARLDEFFATSAPRLATRTGLALFAQIRERYLSLSGR